MQKDLLPTFRFCFVLLVGRKINLWTKVSARSFSRNNFSFAFQENGEKCASYCGGFQRAFIALALIVSVILEPLNPRPLTSTYFHRETQKRRTKARSNDTRESDVLPAPLYRCTRSLMKNTRKVFVVFKNSSGHREKIAKFFSRSKKEEKHFDRPSIRRTSRRIDYR